jgi:branched-chain amino acid aminotransferase
VKVWLNGELLEEEQACISPSDRGLLLGDGVFETLRSYGGRVPTLREHLERLRSGARLLGIAVPADAELEKGTAQLLQANGIAEARIRITVTSGSGPPGLAAGDAGPPTALITASPLQRWPDEASAVVCPWSHNEHSPLAGVKTTSRADTVLGMTYAREHDADEAIFLNTAGHLCEATTANVFVVLDGAVHTPPLSAGCLAGITRELVLRLCRHLDLECAETDLPLDRLQQAREMFLTSSTRGIQPLVRLDSVRVGEGEAGPRTLALAEALSALMSRRA